MLLELGVPLTRIAKRVVEFDLARRRHFLRGCGFVEGDEFVVRELEDAHLANLSVHGATVRAGLDLATLFVDPLANLSSAQIVEVWPS